MNDGVAPAILADIRSNRYEAAAAKLLEQPSVHGDIEEIVFALRRCVLRAADAEMLQATVDDLRSAIECDVTTVVTALGNGPKERSSRPRWQRWRSHPVNSPWPSQPLRDGPERLWKLEVFGFGRFEVVADGSPVERWESGPGQVVLKILVTHHGGPVHRDELMATIWPNAPHQRARNRLNVAIHGLRRSLEMVSQVDIVVFSEGSYRVNNQLATWFDVDQFDDHTRLADRHRQAGFIEAAMSEYQRAVALYVGDLFANDRDGEWVTPARRRLRAQYQDILDELGNHALGTGDLRACIQWSEKLLDLEPWHEPAHERLMRAHARRGQSHLAARQFLACAKVLRSELGVMPGRPVIDLYEQIKRHEPV